MAHLVGRDSYRPYPSGTEAHPATEAEPAVGDAFAHPGAQAEVLPPTGRERLIDIVGFVVVALIVFEVLIATWIAARWTIILVGVVLVTGVLLLVHARPHLPHRTPRPAGPLFPPAERH